MPELLAHVPRILRPHPGDQTIFFAQTPSTSQIVWASLMKAHNRVNAALQAQSKVGVGTESTISQDDVAWLKHSQELPQQHRFVTREFGGDPVDQSPAMQAETCHHLHDRKPATGSLCGRLWISGLILRCIVEANTRAVDHANTPREPQPAFLNSPLELLAYLLVDGLKTLQRQPAAGLTVG
jgi:hypothetical protein